MPNPTSPRFVVIAEFEVKPGRMKDFLALALDDARCSVEHEPGCRTFDVSVDEGDPNAVVFYEVYDDRAAFDAHLATPHLARGRDRFQQPRVVQVTPGPEAAYRRVRDRDGLATASTLGPHWR